MVNEYLPRHIDSRLHAACQSSPILIIDGPRAVGKTTTALRLARSVLRLPQDLDRLKAMSGTTLSELEPPVLIDEWQLAGTDFLWTLKTLVDADPSPGRLLLTGSVEPATYGPTYPLTGRAIRVVLLPMTQGELSGAGDEPTWLSRVVGGEQPKPSAGLAGTFDAARLWFTGFPGGRLQAQPSLFLEGYAALVAQCAGDEGRDASRLLSTLRALAVLEGQAVPDQRIWEAADINKATWKAYEDLLQRTYLSGAIRPFESNRLKRLTGYPKRFLIDTALALSLAGLDVNDLDADRNLAGRYLESFVAEQLRPQVGLVGGELWHLRTGAGQQEIDFVVETGHGLYALEVKASPSIGPADAKHLRWLRDKMGGRLIAGYLLHTGAETYPVDDTIWAVPINELW